MSLNENLTFVKAIGDDEFSINRFQELQWASFTFHAEYVPAGSFKYSCGLPSFAKPASMLLTPKGRTPFRFRSV